ncbi:hypothetical protein Holit_02869 [Hollandina sp. SP2]
MQGIFFLKQFHRGIFVHVKGSLQNLFPFPPVYRQYPMGLDLGKLLGIIPVHLVGGSLLGFFVSSPFYNDTPVHEIEGFNGFPVFRILRNPFGNNIHGPL